MAAGNVRALKCRVVTATNSARLPRREQGEAEHRSERTAVRERGAQAPTQLTAGSARA